MNKEIEIEVTKFFESILQEAKTIYDEYEYQKRMNLIQSRWELGDLILRNKSTLAKNRNIETKFRHAVTDLFDISDRTYQRCLQFRNKFPDLNKVKDGEIISWKQICNDILPEPKAEKKPDKTEVKKNQETKNKLEDLPKEKVIEKHIKLKTDFEEVKKEKTDYKKLWMKDEDIIKSKDKYIGKLEKELKEANEEIKELKTGNKYKQLSELQKKRPPYIDIFNEWYRKIKKNSSFHWTPKANGGIDNCIKNNITPEMFKEAMIKLYDFREDKFFKWEIANLDPSIIYGQYNKIVNYKSSTSKTYAEEGEYDNLNSMPDTDVKNKDRKQEGFFDENN